MTSQIPLFGAPARARNTDPGTSHVAARNVERSGAAGAQRATAFGAVREWPGCTSAELARQMSRDPLTEQKNYRMLGRRLPELREGRIIVNGESRMCSVLKRQALTWELRA